MLPGKIPFLIRLRLVRFFSKKYLAPDPLIKNPHEFTRVKSCELHVKYDFTCENACDSMWNAISHMWNKISHVGMHVELDFTCGNAYDSMWNKISHVWNSLTCGFISHVRQFHTCGCPIKTRRNFMWNFTCDHMWIFMWNFMWVFYKGIVVRYFSATRCYLDKLVYIYRRKLGIIWGFCSYETFAVGRSLTTGRKFHPTRESTLFRREIA